MTDTQTQQPRQPAKADKPVPAPFSHPGKRVFILVPFDENESRRVCDEIEPLVLPLQEAGHNLRITNDLRIGLLGENQIVYACVTREKRTVKNRKVTTETEICVSDPIDCGKYTSISAEDGLGALNVGELTDAIQSYARPYVAQLSADKELSKLKLKLLTT